MAGIFIEPVDDAYALASYIDASGKTTAGYATTVGAVKSYSGQYTVLVSAGYYTPGDGGGGIFVWQPNSGFADNGGTYLTSTGGLGPGTWNRVFDQEYLSVKWFGAKGDGVTNDTTAIQTTINTAGNIYGNTLAVELPYTSSGYAVSGITLQTGTIFRANNGSIVPITGLAIDTVLVNTTMFHQVQGVVRTIIRDLIVYGDNVTLGSAGVIGIHVGDLANMIMENVGVANCKIGLLTEGTQFSPFRNVKAYNCTVGILNLPVVSDGGETSLTYYDPTAVGCIIGMMFALPPLSIFGAGNLLVINPSIESSSVCAMAVVGISPAATGNATGYPQGNIVLVDTIGGSFETTGQGSPPASYSFTYGGNTYTAYLASLYCSYARVTMRSWFGSETNLTGPAMVLKNNSTLLLDNPSSPNSGGPFTSCDASSQVIAGGDYLNATTRTLEGVSSFKASITGYQAFAIQANVSNKNISQIENDEVSPILGDSILAASGATVSVVTSNGSPATQVVFSASVSNYLSNIFYFPVPAAGSANIMIVAFDLVSNTTCQYLSFWANNAAKALLDITANVPVRVYHIYPNYAPDQGYYCFGTNQATASTVQVSNFHTYSSMIDGNASRGIINSIVSGSFNPKMNFIGTGVPSFTAQSGAQYQRLDGGSGTRVYINGATGNNWVAISGV